MKKLSRSLLTVATVGLLSQSGVSTAAVLTQRYSFNDAADSTTVTNSVPGGGSGSLISSDGSSFTGGGQLNLNGIDGYVALPSGIISSLTSVTIETWVTPLNGTPDLARVFDFGGLKNIGSPNPDTDRTYFFLVADSAAQSDDLYTKITDVGGGSKGPPPTAIFLYDDLNGNAGPLVNGTTNYVAVVYDPSANPAAKLYLNGTLVGTSTIASPIPLGNINDSDCFLGRANTATVTVEATGNTHPFNAQYDEFRIWNGVLTDTEILNHYNAGPDSLTPPAGPTLTITNTTDGNVLVSWPVTFNNSLYTSSTLTLPSASWTLVANPVTTSGDGLSHQVSVPISGGANFFLLK